MKNMKIAYTSPEMEIVLFEEKDFLLLSGEAGDTNKDMDWIGSLELGK